MCRIFPHHKSASISLIVLLIIATACKDKADEDPNTPAEDPCGLPGVQWSASLVPISSSNAVTGAFNGTVSILNNPGGPNIFAIQQASVQRKFVLILPNLQPGSYDLHSTYLSYTEKTSDSDPSAKVWKASTGGLQVLACDGGGLAIHTTQTPSSTQGFAIEFAPFSSSASGSLTVGIGARIQ